MTNILEMNNRIYWIYDEDLPERNLFIKDFEPYINNNKNGICGVVELNDEDHYICIELNNKKMKRTNSNAARITMYGENEHLHPMITIDSKLFKNACKKRDFLADFSIYHEVGHFLCGHLGEEQESTEKKLEDRIKCIDNWELYPPEREADRFAAEYVGRNESIRCLEISKHKQFIRLQRLMKTGLDFNTFLSMQHEFDERIKSLKSDEIYNETGEKLRHIILPE